MKKIITFIAMFALVALSSQATLVEFGSLTTSYDAIDTSNGGAGDIELSWNGNSEFGGSTVNDGAGGSVAAGGWLTDTLAGTGIGIQVKASDSAVGMTGVGTSLGVADSGSKPWMMGDGGYITFIFNQDVILIGTELNGWSASEGATITANGGPAYTAAAKIDFGGLLLVQGQELTFAAGTGADWGIKNVMVQTVPEPATIGMVGFAGFVLLMIRRMKRG